MHIQLADGRKVGAGIYCDDNGIVGVSNHIALMALAQNESGFDQAVASKAVEILIDDMLTNLPGGGNNAMLCLRESIDNVNQYLFQLSNGGQFSALDAATSLAVIQYWEGRIYSLLTGNFSCMLLHDRALIKLGDNNGSQIRLGESSEFMPRISEHKVQAGDLLMMINSDDLRYIDQDYARVTLLRFGENLEMALRQMNQKASHNGAQHPPELILARIDNNGAPARGWMNMLGKR